MTVTVMTSAMKRPHPLPARAGGYNGKSAAQTKTCAKQSLFETFFLAKFKHGIKKESVGCACI
jgi:hypothetical protein